MPEVVMLRALLSDSSQREGDENALIAGDILTAYESGPRAPDGTFLVWRTDGDDFIYARVHPLHDSIIELRVRRRDGRGARSGVTIEGLRNDGARNVAIVRENCNALLISIA